MNTYFDYLSTQEKIFLISGLVGGLCLLLFAVLIILMSAFWKIESGTLGVKSQPSENPRKLPPWLTWKGFKSGFGAWMIFGIVGLVLARLLNASQGLSLLGAIVSGGLTFWLDLSMGELQERSHSI